MEYVILNGVNSRSIRGLLIQSLPPITKPQMRTQTEQVDGRDGDIITKLGYSAYDKEISIGLHGEYDVDDVIQFFNSEGEVTFSNEIDKFYRYSILDSIDFDKLIRFKTAKVKFHVQPFKYSAVDRIEDFNITDETSITVFNRGNVFSKPKLTIYGSGTINLSLNDMLILVISLGNLGFITIDAEQMNAYQGDTFLNRQVYGDYSDLSLKIGTNTISWTGDVERVEIENFARWI